MPYRNAYRCSFHTPPFFQCGIDPQPGIPIQEPLFYHFWEQISVFRPRGKQLSTCTNSGRGPRDQSSLFSTKIPYLAPSLAAFPVTPETVEGLEEGVDFQLHPPQWFRSARSPHHCLLVSILLLLISPLPFSPSSWVSDFSKYLRSLW